MGVEIETGRHNTGILSGVDAAAPVADLGKALPLPFDRATATDRLRMLHSAPMSVPPVDLPFIREQFYELATQLRELGDASGQVLEEVRDPAVLNDAMAQLLGILEQVSGDSPDARVSNAELNTLGEYGLHLFDELATLADQLDQAATAAEIRQLCLPFAVWMARQGAEIRNLAPVVNGLAQFANQASQPQAMAALYSYCCELVDAASPACEEYQTGEAHQPWRLLLINRAIVATRSHNPELMAPAFDAIVECLPHEAQRFFAEGMEQMAIIDYPDQVRDLVRRYYLAHTQRRLLH
jgi:hypothetical protein